MILAMMNHHDLRCSGWAAKGRMLGGESDETCLPWTSEIASHDLIV